LAAGFRVDDPHHLSLNVRREINEKGVLG